MLSTWCDPKLKQDMSKNSSLWNPSLFSSNNLKEDIKEQKPLNHTASSFSSSCVSSCSSSSHSHVNGILPNQQFQDTFDTTRDSALLNGNAPYIKTEESKTPSTSLDSSFPSLDLALASKPGHWFDPKTRCFTEEELRPQPISKKGKKQVIETV